MESRICDTIDKSMESSGSDIRQVVEEEHSLIVKVGGFEDLGFASASHSNAGNNVIGGPSEELMYEAKQPGSGILGASDAQNGNKGETILRMDGGLSSGDRLQTSKAPQFDSGTVMHGENASHISAGSWPLGYGFEMGDMVWGKVKSHPWWPGHIFSEAFASLSVRRTKKDGQVLVAFFGDSSYGWFDPAELIPFEPHFTEKSQQSTSRNFLKAVEESVDEACRRSALGLTCFCRNACNFRPTNVPGHMAVDVFDYEPGGIYSDHQVQKARDNFQPERTLSFIEQLAATPQKNSTSLDFVKEKAIGLAYRKAVFEEFDETYAQAFGQEPVRPIAAPPPSVDQSVQANLSGPLVIAESLSGHRSSTKAVKSREQSKRYRYLLKRRDEPGDIGTSHIGKRHLSSSSFSAFENQHSPAAAGEYVFQRRDQAVSDRDQQEDATSAKDEVAVSKAVRGADNEVRHARPLDQEKTLGEDTGGRREFYPPIGKRKKVGVLKGASKRSSVVKSDLDEKKKKWRKDSSGHSDHLQKHSSVGFVGGESGKGDITARPIPTGPPSRAETQPKGISTSSASELVPVVPSGAGVDADAVPAESSQSELRQLLADLKVLAQNPFYGKESNRPAIARQVFLRFRSLVFRKSLAASPSPASGEAEASEVRSAKTSFSGDGTSPGESARSAPPSRPPKSLGKTDDPTKGGKKRVPSENLDDVAAKRAKKVTAVKSAAVPIEKRKAPETRHPDGKGKGIVPVQRKIGAKVEPSVKMQPPKVRVEEPTFLVMKYPPGTSVPSSAELKARFARFGPMDTSQNRVFYTTNMCRILFLYKEDAESAYRFALGNKSTFANVRFMLKPHLVAPDPQAADKVSRDSSRSGEETSTDYVQPTPPHMQPPSSVLLKSCLKKPAGDEGGSQNSAGVRGARVRFNVGETRGASASGGVQTMDPRANSSCNLPEAGSGSSSSLSVDMDVPNNQRNIFSKQPLQPPFVFPQYSSALHNHPSQEVASRNHSQHHTYTTRLPPPPASQAPTQPPPEDISQQMLNLLTRCNDVVSNVKSILGYVPYHSL